MKDSEVKWGAFIEFLLAQVGKPYVYGVENDPKADPSTYKAWDCSELSRVAFAKIGIIVPDGSYNQARVVHAVSPNSLRIGDLGFLMIPDTGVIHHVGIFIGNRKIGTDVIDTPTVIEAKGKSWGVVLTPATKFMSTPQFAKWGRLNVIQDA